MNGSVSHNINQSDWVGIYCNVKIGKGEAFPEDCPHLQNSTSVHRNSSIFIDREPGEIIRLVASVFLCLFVCLSVCLSVCPSSPVKNIRESSSQGAFKMVGRSKLSSFRQVAPPRSIMLLILS